MTTIKTDTQPAAFIGINLGDTKPATCVSDKRGTILREYSIPTTRKQIEKLALEYPNALFAMEVGNSPYSCSPYGNVTATTNH